MGNADIWIAIIVAIIGSKALDSLINLFGDKVKRKWKKDDDATSSYVKRIDNIESKLNVLTENQEAIKKSQKVTTRERIRYLGLCYIGAKKVTLEDKETLLEMHDAYEQLGGNGALDTVISEVNKLPVIENWTSKL